MSQRDDRVVQTISMADINAKEFDRRFYRPRIPVRIVNATQRWPTPLWSWEYVKAKIGHRLTTVSCNSEGVFDFNPDAATGVVTRKSMSINEAFELLFSDQGNRYYVFQQEIETQFPELHRDVVSPGLLDNWTVLELVNLWMSGKGCRTQLHFDNSDNFLVQMNSAKRLTLFPPEQRENLYPAIGRLLPHMSLLNVFAPDRSRFPLYEMAHAHRREVVVEAGDLLYIPATWWHAVESLDAAISINFWWHCLVQP